MTFIHKEDKKQQLQSKMAQLMLAALSSLFIFIHSQSQESVTLACFNTRNKAPLCLGGLFSLLLVKRGRLVTQDRFQRNLLSVI